MRKNIEGATALRLLRPLSIVPLSFLGFPAQSVFDDKPGLFSWQAKSAGFSVESCARLCKIWTVEEGNEKATRGLSHLRHSWPKDRMPDADAMVGPESSSSALGSASPLASGEPPKAGFQSSGNPFPREVVPI